MNNNFNQWAEYVRFGTRYVAPKETPQGYYFNTEVFKKSQKKTSILGFIKKMLGLAIICSVMASCSTYTGMSNGKGCGVWYPKKYKASAPKQRTSARMVSF